MFARSDIREAVAQASGEILFTLTSEDGVEHGLTRVSDRLSVERLQRLFDEVDVLYIADGHHRSAAASRVAARLDGQRGSAWFLCGIFPDDSLNCMAYNRMVRDLGGFTPSALLKTLEEPPGASVFVLVSSRPDVLLATVRSRCPRLRFGRLTAAEVTETLVRDHGYTEADARAAAASADGSIGRALGADSTSVAQAREVASRALQTATASADPKRRMECAKDLIAKNKKKGAPAADREALALRLRAMTSLLRDVGLVLSGGNDAGLANADLGSEVMKLADRYDGDRIVRAFSAVDRALGALTVRNASPKVVADWLVLQL